MEKPLARVGRDNHLKHLTHMMPIIMMLFLGQCYVMYTISEGADFGNYALFLGGLLASFISFMVYYDSNHHVLFYKDNLQIMFELTGTDRIIAYSDIKEIHAPEQECAFSHVTLELENEEKVVLLFVDYPVQVKLFIEEHSKGKQEDLEDDQDLAA